MVSRLDRLIVPATFVAALLAVLLVTVSWVPHPVQPIGLYLNMGPQGIVPRHLYGLRFTPRNPLSHHVLTTLVPSQRHCVDVTIANSSLTFVDQRKACRLKDGSYKLPYRFPQADDYVVFVQMQPMGGLPHTVRKAVPLDLCWLRRGQHWHGVCRKRPAKLRGLEVVRSHTVRGMTVVLGAPAHAAQVGQRTAVTFVFLHNGRGVPDLQTVYGTPGEAVAISADSKHFVRLYPDPGQVAKGHVKGGVVSFSGWFDTPSIYRVSGTFRRHGHPVHASFVIDVNPRPTPTPTPD